MIDTLLLKKGDRIISHEIMFGVDHPGVVTGCGKKTFTIKHDEVVLGISIHYHRNIAKNYYMTFKKEPK